MSSVIRGSDNFDSLVHQGLGVNQTWQNVTASRALGTTYTNSTGKPIMIRVNKNNVANTGWSMFVNGVVVAIVNGYGTGNGASVIVPNGATYSADTVNALLSWFELR